VGIVWSLVAAYLPSYFDGTEYTAQGRYWPWFAKLDLWRKGMAYFPARIEYEQELDSTKQYMFASHPHGAMSVHHGMYLLDGVGFFKVCMCGSRIVHPFTLFIIDTHSVTVTEYSIRQVKRVVKLVPRPYLRFHYIATFVCGADLLMLVLRHVIRYCAPCHHCCD
jgi:hypothetical protein